MNWKKVANALVKAVKDLSRFSLVKVRRPWLPWAVYKWYFRWNWKWVVFHEADNHYFSLVDIRKWVWYTVFESRIDKLKLSDIRRNKMWYSYEEKVVKSFPATNEYKSKLFTWFKK